MWIRFLSLLRSALCRNRRRRELGSTGQLAERCGEELPIAGQLLYAGFTQSPRASADTRIYVGHEGARRPRSSKTSNKDMASRVPIMMLLDLAALAVSLSGRLGCPRHPGHERPSEFCTSPGSPVRGTTCGRCCWWRVRLLPGAQSLRLGQRAFGRPSGWTSSTVRRWSVFLRPGSDGCRRVSYSNLQRNGTGNN